MKKTISVMLAVVLCLSLATAVYADNTLTLQIGNPNFSVDGAEIEIDPGRGTAPVIRENRTMLPVRAIVEAIGGTVDYSDMGDQQIIHIEYDGTVISLVIGVPLAFQNGGAVGLDTAPVIINERTFIPVRFVAESFGYSVDWDGETQTVTIRK